MHSGVKKREKVEGGCASRYRSSNVHSKSGKRQLPIMHLVNCVFALQSCCGFNKIARPERLFVEGRLVCANSIGGIFAKWTYVDASSPDFDC